MVSEASVTPIPAPMAGIGGKRVEQELSCTVTLSAQQYRRLWLDEAHANGQIAEVLAEALGWQPTSEQPLPDALALAGAVAERVVALEAQLVLTQLPTTRLQHRDWQSLTCSVN